jgi:hypothetical protein
MKMIQRVIRTVHLRAELRNFRHSRYCLLDLPRQRSEA